MSSKGQDGITDGASAIEYWADPARVAEIAAQSDEAAAFLAGIAKWGEDHADVEVVVCQSPASALEVHNTLAARLRSGDYDLDDARKWVHGRCATNENGGGV